MANQMMQRVGKRILTAALALLIAGPAMADCKPPAAWVGAIEAANPTVAVMARAVPADQVPVMVRAFNSTPPVDQTVAADSALVLMGVSKQTGMPLSSIKIGLFNGGCFVGAMTLPAPNPGDPA